MEEHSECIQGSHCILQLTSGLREPCWGRVNLNTAPTHSVWATSVTSGEGQRLLPETAGPRTSWDRFSWEPAVRNPQTAPKRAHLFLIFLPLESD